MAGSRTRQLSMKGYKIRTKGVVSSAKREMIPRASNTHSECRMCFQNDGERFGFSESRLCDPRNVSAEKACALPGVRRLVVETSLNQKAAEAPVYL